MGTLIEVTLWSDSQEQADLGSHLVFDEFQRVDKLMTTWLPENSVGLVNQHAHKKPVVVDKETFDVVKTSVTWSKRLFGVFDITIGAFKGLWKFDHDNDGTLPDAASIKKQLPLVNYKNLALNPSKNTIRFKKAGMRISLGGIAKGYALDNAVKLLRKNQIRNFIIQAGGDMFIGGTKGTKSWTVGIRDPRGPLDAVFAYAKIKNKTFSTSGDYERFTIKDGIRYHHILNPKTGYPAKKSRSVTVVTDSAIDADVLSTALFILGPEKGMPLVETSKNVDAVFVDAHGNTFISTGLKGKIQFP